jgi:methionyl-tRNA synthetase
VQKVNSDLVGKVVNLASRTARFVDKLADTYPDDSGLFTEGARAGTEIADAYAAVDLSRAMRAVMSLADRANEYVDQKQPWTLKKDPAKAEELRAVCTVTLNLYRQLVIYLAPVLPKLAEASAHLLNTTIDAWSQAQTPLLGTPLNRFEHMLQRVDKEKVAAMIADSRDTEESDRPTLVTVPSTRLEPLAPECNIEDFSKIDLRIVKIIHAEAIAEADKLLKLTVSLGAGDERTVFAGIKRAYAPETLVGRHAVMVANLKPRKMRFGTSEGMLLAASSPEAADHEVFLLEVDAGAKSGQRVR